jgi:membrane associated rhomboid family serine protease
MTLFILGLTLLISVSAFYQRELMQKLIFHPQHIAKTGEYYRFLSSGFLHANWLHLLINVLVLWFFGRVVEQYFMLAFGQITGLVLYGAMYMTAIIVSELPTYTKHKNHPQYASLGASGAVSAVVFSSILFQPLEYVYLMGILPIPGIVFAILYLVYSAKMAQESRDNINHDAHFYGALWGLLFTIVFKPQVVIHFFNQLTKWFG